MNTLLKIKNQIKEAVIEATGEKISPEKIEITTPPSPEMGDLAVSCFYLAKVLKISPNQISIELAEKISLDNYFSKITAEGAYLNFYLNTQTIADELIKDILSQADKYGQKEQNKNKLMIEFSQPNTHKEFHIGHLRNAVLGDALVNLKKITGNKVIAVNYIGDVGSHVAKCLWALNKFHQDEQLPENKGKFLGQVYAEASQKTENEEKAKKEADKILQKLEAGDKKWLKLWKETRQWSLDEFDKIYDLLDIKFDHFFYESEVEKAGKKMVAELLDNKVAEKSEGAVIINLEKENLKNFLLLKSDGSSLYSTKDLALAKLKFEKYKVDESVYVVDTRQSFYFKQLFKTLEIMGFDKKMSHIPYEFVTLADGAMSSRQGNVVLFEDFFAQVVEEAEYETKKRHQDWPEDKIKNTAKIIALGAIKFNMLKVGNNSVIVFNIKEALSFEGFSGPYIQYTVSRINSIFKKATDKEIKKIKIAEMKLPQEKDLLIKLLAYEEIIERASDKYEPSELAKYLFELAQIFASFYQNVPVLKADKEVKQSRLALCSATRQVLKNGLNIMGIDVLEEM